MKTPWPFIMAVVVLCHCAPEATSGRLVHGLVKDGRSGLPVPGITVIVDGQSTVTGPLGEYGLRTTASGSIVTADGRPRYPTVMTVFGVVDEQDFVLIPTVTPPPSTPGKAPVNLQGTVVGFTAFSRTQVNFGGTPLGFLPDSSGAFSFTITSSSEDIINGALSVTEWYADPGIAYRDFLLQSCYITSASAAAGQIKQFGALTLTPATSLITFTLTGRDPSFLDMEAFIGIDVGIMGLDLVAYNISMTAMSDALPVPDPVGNGYLIEGRACDYCPFPSRAQFTDVFTPTPGGHDIPFLPAIAASLSNASSPRPTFMWSPVNGAQQYQFLIYDSNAVLFWEGIVSDPAAYGANTFVLPISLNASGIRMFVAYAYAFGPQTAQGSFHAFSF